jgi:hypothetical protein
MRQLFRENAALRRLYYRLKLQRAKGQSDESKIIECLSADAPRTFVEIGFHPIEFNCIDLTRSSDWRGLLVDGSERQVSDARYLFPDRIDIIHRFLTLDNLDFIKSSFREIGVLSIDVDGNDYWFLKALIDTKPALICVEYNSSFGLEPVTIPYDPSFDRHKAHQRGWYHGASLTALAKLCSSFGYGLAGISDNGINAFFTKTGTLDPAKAWRPNAPREKMSGVDHVSQWREIKRLPLVVV